MFRKCGILRGGLFILLATFSSQLADAADRPLASEVTAAMRQAATYYREQVAAHGGYVYFYSLDLSQRWGEGSATADQIWVQPPGTPTVGLGYLKAYQATGDKFYLAAATDAALALAYGQLKSGGWTNCIDFDPRGRRVADYRNGKGRGKNNSSLDDGQTQSAIRLMIHTDRALEFQHEVIHESAQAALDALLNAQFPNGAFPQVWTGPVEQHPVMKASYPGYDWRTEGRIKNYWDLYTLNDNVAGYVADTLIDAYTIYDDERYVDALRRLGDFLVLAQMPDPQPAWAQQYNYDMQPVWARKFEPPAIASDESQEAIETLMKIYRVTGDRKYLEPIPRTLAWLRQSRLPDGSLARYYELQTNRPLYMERRGDVYRLTYDDSNLPSHYGWKIESRVDALEQEYAQRLAGQSTAAADVSVDRAEQTRRILGQLDGDGRWISTYQGEALVGQPKFERGSRYLSSEVFSRNLTALSEYLLAASPAEETGARRARTWTDRSGRFSVEAVLVEVRGDSVQLRRSDGKVVAVPLKKLSDADQRYIAAQRSTRPTSAAHDNAERGGGPPAMAVAPPAEDLEILLVKNGKPVHNMICLPNDQADPAAVQALKEYRSLIAKATGTEPIRVEEPVPDTPTIFFGSNPWSDAAGVTTAGLPAEGFRIRSVGQDIHIVGRDTPGVGAHQVVARLGMEPGTLFGTYEFLERYYDMLFAWHDDLGTVTPPQQDLTIKSMHIVDGPDCSYRQFTKSPAGQANQIFGRRLRLGHPIEVRHEHNWHRIMSPDVFGQEHPEWFAEINGKRYPKHYAEKRGGQVCTSNQEVVEHFAKAAIDHFNKRPDADMFSIAANDGRKFCTCRECLAQDSGRTRPDGRRVTTDRIITFSNQVAERVAKVHPDKRLGVIIYLDYKYPPQNVKPHPMLFLVHPTNSGFSQGAYYEGDAWSEAAMERGWHKAAGTFYKYDIWHYDQTPLYMIAPVTNHLIEKCRAQQDHGVDGGYHYIARSYELLGAGHYLLARLLWDNDFNAEAAEQAYYSALYGAAADDVKAYYDLLENALVRVFKNGPAGTKEAMIASFFHRYPGANNPGMYLAAYWPILPRMQQAIDRAASKRNQLSDRENERLLRLIDHHEYTTHTVAAMIYVGRGLTGSASSNDRQAFATSKSKREAAKTRIAAYRPYYAKLIDELDANSHTGVLYGKKPTIDIRAPSDFNQ